MGAGQIREGGIDMTVLRRFGHNDLESPRTAAGANRSRTLLT